MVRPEVVSLLSDMDPQNALTHASGQGFTTGEADLVLDASDDERAAATAARARVQGVAGATIRTALATALQDAGMTATHAARLAERSHLPLDVVPASELTKLTGPAS